MNSCLKVVHATLILFFFATVAVAEPKFEPNLPQYQVGVCSEFVWVDSEFQRACLSASLTHAGEYSVTAFVECKAGEGTCPDSPWGRNRSYCYADSETSEGVIEQGNGQQFEINLTPADCKFVVGSPEGAQLSAKTNGTHVLTTDYERLLSRYRADGQICWSSLGGGNQVKRSADILAVVDGWAIESNELQYIVTWRSEREINYCKPDE
jgi:hypothetical protein